ncbi:MAG: GGDEF domain-containing protein [Elusimicrobia bacterium]|nr:GGDEF domain-containing protein [Elusimicrobiota bacterium]
MPVIKERRQSPGEAEEGLWESLPHHVLYPLFGLLLGAVFPVGAFLIRFWLANPVFKLLWIRSELSYNAVFYLYMEASTIAAFMVFGYVLGGRSEGLRTHTRELRKRIDLLHLKSITDGLTGAYSHAYLWETLSVELDRCRRQGLPLSVLMLDIDNFKPINDTHGHLFGDRVLVELVETVSLTVRQQDLVGRYGGEEFFVIMPGADQQTAALVAERVRRAAARRYIVDEREQADDLAAKGIRMTLSIGVSTAGYGDDARTLIRHADENLYRAKRDGKNRVAVTAPQVELPQDLPPGTA